MRAARRWVTCSVTAGPRSWYRTPSWRIFQIKRHERVGDHPDRPMVPEARHVPAIAPLKILPLHLNAALAA